jgi:hypothetical protein
MFNIFEHPWGLIITAIAALLALLIFRSVKPEKRYWWQWLLPVILVAAAFGLDLLVQTNLEKIKAVLKTAVKAVEQENPDAIEAVISNNYRDSLHTTRDALIAHCRAKLSEPLVDKSFKTILEMDISPPTASVLFTVRLIFDKRSYIYRDFKPLMIVKAKLNLQKEQNEWFISRIEILEIDRLPAKWQNVR